jgi:MFS transporter, DHA3 family, macrolide efflux protein
VYMAVLSGLSTVVQLHAPQAYRGRVLSFFLVALGVSYPLGALAQGPVADQIGIGWMTAGSALLLVLACGLLAVLRPGLLRALAVEPTASPDSPKAGGRLVAS